MKYLLLLLLLIGCTSQSKKYFTLAEEKLFLNGPGARNATMWQNALYLGINKNGYHVIEHKYKLNRKEIHLIPDDGKLTIDGNRFKLDESSPKLISKNWLSRE